MSEAGVAIARADDRAPHGTAPRIEAHPLGVAGLDRPGPDPMRVLLFGSGALRGLGVHDHEFGLPGRLADRFAQSGRGVDLDVIVDTRPTAPSALEGLRGLRLRRYDVIVVVLEEQSGSLRPGRGRRRAALSALLALLHAEAAPGAAVVVLDSSRAMRVALGGRAGTGGSEERIRDAASVAGIPGDRLGFGELTPPPHPLGLGSRFSAATYREWADVIARVALPQVEGADALVGIETARVFRNRPDFEPHRQLAVRCLGLDRSAPRSRALDLLTRQVKYQFRVDLASLNILDGDLMWQRAASSQSLRVVPRTAVFCDLAIRIDGPTLINDTLTDPRTRDHPRVRAAEGIRFYAASPVHSWDGYRIGTLCMIDSRARAFRLADLEVLRGFTAKIERELWWAGLGAEHHV